MNVVTDLSSFGREREVAFLAKSFPTPREPQEKKEERMVPWVKLWWMSYTCVHACEGFHISLLGRSGDIFLAFNECV